jgi:hypothetical protein
MDDWTIGEYARYDWITNQCTILLCRAVFYIIFILYRLLLHLHPPGLNQVAISTRIDRGREGGSKGRWTMYHHRKIDLAACVFVFDRYMEGKTREHKILNLISLEISGIDL